MSETGLYALLLAAEEERSGIDLIIPDLAELIWGIISFVIVFAVLNKVVLPRIKEMIDKRSDVIQGNLKDAEAAKDEAQGALDEYKNQLAEARSEANRIVEEARQQAEQVRKDIVAKAERDAEVVLARAQEQIEAEQSRALAELHATISTMSIELAEKVVGRTIDASTQKELVDAYIRDVATMSSDGGRNN